LADGFYLRTNGSPFAQCKACMIEAAGRHSAAKRARRNAAIAREKAKAAHGSKARILELLADNDRTTQQLARLLGLSRCRTNLLVKELRQAKPKQVYVVRWVAVPRNSRNGPQPVRVYALGSQPDAPKPVPTTSAERRTKSRARVNDTVSEALNITAAWIRECSSPMTNSSS
jgi:hypothetical protein